MNEPEPYLTGILLDIAEVAGWKAAIKVAQLKGGRRAYFPADPKDTHWLVEAVGKEKAHAIGKCLANEDGIELEVPLGPAASRMQRWAQMERMIDEGRSKPDIAAALGVHHKTVQRHKNGHSGQTRARQLDLFSTPAGSKCTR